MATFVVRNTTQNTRHPPQKLRAPSAISHLRAQRGASVGEGRAVAQRRVDRLEAIGVAVDARREAGAGVAEPDVFRRVKPERRAALPTKMRMGYHERREGKGGQVVFLRC